MLVINRKSQELVDNSIVINGVEVGKLTDTDTQKLLDIISGMRELYKPSSKASQPTKVSTTLHMEPEKSEDKSIEGKKVFEDAFTTITKMENGKYRWYLHCHIGGDRGSKIRYALKSNVKDFGAVWSGNHKTKTYHWTFPNEDAAYKYIDSRVEYCQKNQEEPNYLLVKKGEA